MEFGFLLVLILIWKMEIFLNWANFISVLKLYTHLCFSHKIVQLVENLKCQESINGLVQFNLTFSIIWIPKYVHFEIHKFSISFIHFWILYTYHSSLQQRRWILCQEFIFQTYCTILQCCYNWYFKGTWASDSDQNLQPPGSSGQICYGDRGTSGDKGQGHRGEISVVP